MALSYPWLSGHVSIPWDAKAHFYPQLQFLSRSIYGGEWPWWNPYVFSGHPQIADPQSLIFSPVFLLLASITPEPGFVVADATVFALLFAGAVAIFLLARDRRWHPAAALLAALVFGFGGSASWRIQHVGQIHSLAMWAVAWLCLSRSLDRVSMSWGIATGFAAAAMLLGRDQVARLMRIVGISGVRRGRHTTVTTRRDERAVRHPDLVNRGWSLPSRPPAGSSRGRGRHGACDRHGTTPNERYPGRGLEQGRD